MATLGHKSVLALKNSNFDKLNWKGYTMIFSLQILLKHDFFQGGGLSKNADTADALEGGGGGGEGLIENADMMTL